MNQEQVWILGGTQIDESTEFFDGIEWKSGPKLEKTLSKHCVLNWDDGKTMIIGGKPLSFLMHLMIKNVFLEICLFSYSKTIHH